MELLKPFEMTILDNTVEINYNKAITDEEGYVTGYEMATAEVPAATALMTSFNRIGATWAGGGAKLKTVGMDALSGCSDAKKEVKMHKE